ncbi:MAG: diguanylate cyclase [Desulfobacteraceae bacterium]|nr:diguanylate cyclase [Desulfobacteraceae bacterium]
MEVNFPILVVDDDVVSRTVMEKYLHKAGFEVISAPNGKEALARMDEQFCPIVLTDWMMPEISGPELCRLIREKKTDRYVFIILITARDSKTDIVSGLESGADDYLTKPIHPAELVARINTGIRILKLEQSLKNANEEIRLLSITDPLTGCFNRTYLGERFPQEINRAQRYSHSLSVVIADIDYFKKINDAHGHHAGDLVLKSFAKCLMGSIRESVDWVVRYGGEEFLIILPETASAGVTSVSERLRRAVSNLKVSHDGKEISVTASFGGACLYFGQKGNQGISMEELINHADEQLYRSKNEGRNRVNVVEVMRPVEKSR